MECDRHVQPDYAEAINNLGTIYYGQKSYRRAVSTYKRALHLTPRAASIYSNLGTAYFARKDYKNAALNYQTALEIDPALSEPGLAWGAAKAFEHKRRHAG